MFAKKDAGKTIISRTQGTSKLFFYPVLNLLINNYNNN
jgi:hypothetical protein